MKKIYKVLNPKRVWIIKKRNKIIQELMLFRYNESEFAKQSVQILVERIMLLN